ncbi:MAG TPA: aminotransferase class I/II-fold pyridoxal phosphate-dependent enzyme [Thermodesulfatator atlanticus]|uniref:Aminotransferase class I/II-fold pyridoxal phosphate-dependent enzyme n=1 Tax=Thermodesulfatator atlanticus TaxID=501497 RepID=A0A7V5P1Q6_9BACT|nr:aminotransferase class I/II-fold pyridoxal phosphate-dependent enzyme [Thermodesulfatator atlanticus]
MGIFDKFSKLAAQLNQVRALFGGFNVVIEKIISPTEAIVNGQKVILAGTNNYLGLTFDKACIEAACAAIRAEGTGTTGSRMANGTYHSHVALEQELSEFFGRRATIVFTTGYAANLGVLSTLVGRDDLVLLDADCHASIYDGTRLGGVPVYRFRHNDVEDLEKKLRRLREKNPSANILIVVEGLYSMLGDRAPLADIAHLKEKYGAYLLVDEAHSLGVLGEKGRGLAEEAGVEDKVDFIVGTFSKSLASIGGYCTSNYEELELLRYASRPYVFTASLSPANIAAARAALRIIRERPELKERLWQNAYQLYGRLKELGFELGPEPSPIVAVRFRQPEKALKTWYGLLERGVYVNMVLPPATPGGEALLRASVSAAHTPAQIAAISEAFAALA